MASFHLSKWYLDVVDEEGTAFIGYAADLRWGGIRVQYASAIVARPNLPPVTSTALLGSALPVEHEGAITWRCEGLAGGVAGEWLALDAPATHTLYASPDGEVRWDCRMPRARARVAAGDLQLEGLGYVERLDLTLPPWSLPIRELRWGRALAHEEGLTWVDWRGGAGHAHEVQVVLHREGRLAPCAIDDAGIRVDGITLLALEPGASLRKGALGPNVLSALPGPILRRLPRRITAVDERKMLCRGRLGGHSAWCIHEVVTFP